MHHYSLAGFSEMIRDRVRMEAYQSALQQAIKPGAIVVDIGAGTGIFSFLACRFGAEKVYAIEPSDSIQVAREIAKTNGFADRIEFIQCMSTDVTLEKKAAVIVSDLRGVTPLHESHLPTIIHAREHLLAPGGRLIPQRDRLWMALVEVPKEYRELEKCWQSGVYDLDLSAIRKHLTNSPRKMRAEPEQLLMEPRQWAALDYERLRGCNVAGEAHALATRDGVAHALCLWFDTDLCDGVGFSNAPGQPESIYGQWMLPLSAPIEIAAGDSIKLQIHADLVGDNYLWRWNTTVHGVNNPDVPKAEFSQSTLASVPLSLAGLQKRADDYVPELNGDGIVDREVLTAMSQQTPLGEIATRLTEQYPERYGDWTSALSHIGDLAQKYSR